MKQPLDDLLTFAERAYVRMEAEQLINQCLDQGDPSLFFDLIKGLVLAGSSSLGVMREILEEIRSARTSLTREGMTVRQELMEALTEFGVHLPQLLSADAPEAFRAICSRGLRREAHQAAGRLTQDDEVLLEEICQEAGNRVSTIARRLMLLVRLEESVEDWLTSLAYEATQTGGWPGTSSRPQSVQ
jgi:hypothetical protein